MTILTRAKVTTPPAAPSRPDIDADKMLEERREVIVNLRARLAPANDALADLFMRRATGESVDPGEIVRIEGQRAELTREIEREEQTIAAIHHRIGEWRRQESQERRDAAATRLAEIEAEGRALEERYHAAASAMVDIAKQLNRLRSESNGLHSALSSHDMRFAPGVTPFRHRVPSMPYEIPSRFVRRADPNDSFDRWLDDWRETHR